MLTKAAIMDQAEQIAQRSGKFRYLKKGTTTALRILEFTDQDGNTIFARPLAEHREKDKSGKSIGVCRMGTFGLPCAYCRVNEALAGAGKEKIFVTRTRYVCNAVDINDDKKQVRMWVLPTSVFEDVAAYGADDEWGDICEAKGGYPFRIARTGEGLDTNYEVKVGRQPYPIDKSLASQVVDPLTEILDPGLEKQCKDINIDINKLFDESELESMNAASSPSTKKTNTKSGKATNKSEPKEEESAFAVGELVLYGDETEPCTVKAVDGTTLTIEDAAGDEYDVDETEVVPYDAGGDADGDVAGFAVGDFVLYQDEDSACEVTAVDGDAVTIRDSKGEEFEVEMSDLSAAPPVGPVIERGSTVRYKDEKDTCTVVGVDGEVVTIEDKNGDEYEASFTELSLVSDGKSKARSSSDKPKCFANPDMYDADDPDCKGCSSKDECEGNMELDKAGVGKREAPKGRSAKTGKPGKSSGSKTAADEIADLFS